MTPCSVASRYGGHAKLPPWKHVGQQQHSNNRRGCGARDMGQELSSKLHAAEITVILKMLMLTSRPTSLSMCRGLHHVVCVCTAHVSCVQDDDPYVRKTAAVCVSKLFDINPELVEDRGFLDMLRVCSSSGCHGST